MGLPFCLAPFFAATQALALSLNEIEQDGGGLVVGDSGYQFATVKLIAGGTPGDEFNGNQF